MINQEFQGIPRHEDGTILLRDFITHLTELAAEPGMEDARVALHHPTNPWVGLDATTIVGCTEGLTGQTTMVVGLVESEPDVRTRTRQEQAALDEYLAANPHPPLPI